MTRSANRLLKQLGRDGFGAPAGQRFPRVAAAELIRLKLAAPQADGQLRLTSAGEAALARKPSDTASAPDRFRAQHETLSTQKVTIEGAEATVYCNDAESPLLWMRRRKGADGEPIIGAAAFAAGERLRLDYTMSRTAPRMGIDWSNPLAGSRNGGSAGLNAAESIVAAGQRMNAALQAVGPEFSGLLFDLCCFLKGLEQIERERRWPVRSAKVVARLALDRLARHYGFSDETRGRERSGVVRVWTAGESGVDA
ncbi:MAG: DNA replication protein [Beijerinckiaceae bacterium]|nr:DNA replication protein [Beijerinckiaceae bacterium]